jgi:23S rRNA (guanosine2251-2'-O)-methyltransferase
VPVTRARRGELDRLVDGARHQGIVLEVESLGEFTINRFERLVLERGARLRLLVLDGVEDPRNLGACLRTADAAAIDAVIVPKSRSCKLTAVAAKAATGAAETVPVLYAPNLVRTLDWLKQAGVWIVGTDAAAEASIFEADLTTPVAMVLGGEGRGLRRLTRDTCDQLVSIPMLGTVESLNVSVATGVALFELLRQCPSAKASPDA